MFSLQAFLFFGYEGVPIPDQVCAYGVCASVCPARFFHCLENIGCPDQLASIFIHTPLYGLRPKRGHGVQPLCGQVY